MSTDIKQVVNYDNMSKNDLYKYVKTSGTKAKKTDSRKELKVAAEDNDAKMTDGGNTKKKGFKMPTAFTILFGIILFALILTWAVPSGFYIGTEYYNAGQQPLGIVDAFMSIGYGFVDAAGLVFFLFGIGAFINMIMKSQAMESALGASLRKYKGKEIWIIPFLMLFFAIGGTTYGMAEETIAFYVILVPVFILAGFDAMTGVFIILLGAGVGVLASTVNPFAVGAAYDSINSAVGAETFSVGQGIGFRLFSFFIVYGLAVAFTMWYAKRVQDDVTLSALDEKSRAEHIAWAEASYNLDDVPKFDGRKIATLVVFAFALIWMVFSLLPWDAWGVEAFVNLSDNVATNAPWVSAQQGWTIGWWYFIELGVFFIIMAVIVALINRQSEREMMANAVEGASDMVGVALIIGVSRGVAIMLQGFQTAEIVGVVDATGSQISEFTISYGTGSRSNEFTVLAGTAEFDNILASTGAEIITIQGMPAEVGFNGATGAYYADVNMTNAILNGMSGIANLPFAVYNMTIYWMYLPLSFLIPSTSGLAGATMGIMGPLAVASAEGFGVSPETAVAATVTGYAFASGTLNLFTPTSGVVMGGLAVSKIEYGTYLKAVWKFLLAIFIACTVLMALGAAGGFIGV